MLRTGIGFKTAAQVFLQWLECDQVNVDFRQAAKYDWLVLKPIEFSSEHKTKTVFLNENAAGRGALQPSPLLIWYLILLRRDKNKNLYQYIFIYEGKKSYFYVRSSICKHKQTKRPHYAIEKDQEDEMVVVIVE